MRHSWSSVLLLAITAAFATPARSARIYVTTLEDKISSTGGCSLKEAIYSAVLAQAHPSADGIHGMAIAGYIDNQPNFIATECVLGDGVDDTIVLPTAPFRLIDFVNDADNFLGPTATPIISTRITIEGNGATLEGIGPVMRLFAVGFTGRLTLKFVTIKNFGIKGGNGAEGGGGGMGAGGAIYVAGPEFRDHPGGILEVENCTFLGNQALGGTGGGPRGRSGIGGGGGGLSGNGSGDPLFFDNGGGGGGSRGNGAVSNETGGGAGGGTVFSGVGVVAGFSNGGAGGVDGNGGDGGLGGGGGGSKFDCGCDGGKGGYGGGGGGAGGQSSDGGDGGFGGGGGGSESSGGFFGANGGSSEFGGGAGAGAGGSISGGGAGQAGLNGGWANDSNGGGGAALGGAIFSDQGQVTVENSTFFNNSVYRGDGGGVGTSNNPGGNGADLGAALYSFHGILVIRNSTISNNLSTGPLGGVIFDNRPLPCDDSLGSVCLGLPNGSFTLSNTIVAHNGGDFNSSKECSILGDVPAELVLGSGNLIVQNDTGGAACPGLAAQDDPQLGNLQENLGLTPTMAIPHGSPAWGTADGGLDPDQRGQKRPSKDGHGYDIGAFELCESDDALLCVFPKSTGGIPTTPRTLTMLVSPPSMHGDVGGTTTPAAPGIYLETTNSVVLLTATPSLGFYFLNWTGGVANNPTSPSNAVVMDQDRTLTANFQLHAFSLTASPKTLTIPLGGTGSSAVTATAFGDFADRVDLAASGGPAGVNASFNPNAITPVPGTNALSILLIAVGSSVTPQTFTETVSGAASGLAGSLTNSAQVSVTVVATAAAIVNVINQDQALHCIDNAGISQSLIAKVNAYQTLASRAQIQAATNALAAFQDEVLAQIGKHIVTTCKDPVGGNQFYTGQTLVTDSQSLQATLKTPLKPNPIVSTVVNSSNVGIAGATVNLLNSSKTVIATTTTDAMGFYYFAETSGLTAGTNYTVKVTPLKPYKTATTSTFNWQGTAVTLPNLVLN